jgi:negative regulator of flagellin synthesis FlgM
MKINPSIEALRNRQDTAQASDRAAGSKGGASASAPSGSDRVELSSLSAQIAAIESQISAEPGFDRARVEAIKQAIAEGRLAVDAEVVAERMIASALAMLKPRQ